MIVKCESVLLFIEPNEEGSWEALIDPITMKIYQHLRASQGNKGIVFNTGRFELGTFTRGHHTCRCGAQSHACDYLLDDGKMATNFLCVHYAAYHRDEIPQGELDKINKLSDLKEDVNVDEVETFLATGKFHDDVCPSGYQAIKKRYRDDTGIYIHIGQPKLKRERFYPIQRHPKKEQMFHYMYEDILKNWDNVHHR